MRPAPFRALPAHHLIRLTEPPPSPPTFPECVPSTRSCGRWRPYSNSDDFEANAAVILIVLFSALICALSLNVAVRCFLRRHRQNDSRVPKPVPAAAAPVAPTVVFTEGMRLAGETTECAICLTEFEDGEGIKVVGRCEHAFHVQCIERWFGSQTTCPTCRCSCLPGAEQGGAGDVAGTQAETDVSSRAAVRLPEQE